MATLPKIYEPRQYEPTVYGLWEASRSFAPSGKGEPYAIVMPPPNANGDLHLGHALMAALEDILIRYHRLKGRDTVYIPGADHAGFETWVVYERALQQQGKSRFDYSREELYQQVWDFVESQRGNMELQLRAMGVSASWDDLVFTLDKKVIDTVYTTFKKLWDDGLVYRGERMVNYCTLHQTSFADIEVEHREEASTLWHIAYPLGDGQGKGIKESGREIHEIIVATTRPETMLGDTAVAVHPDDTRYKALIGRTVTVPLVGREIPIIADEAVDPGFGTGAVKITPAHDPMDFEVGQRHDLPLIQVIGFDGKMTDETPADYRGMEVLAAREKITTLLRDQGVIRSEEAYTHTVGHCYKCGTVIQPLVKDQWFLKVRPLAEAAKQAIEAGKVTFTPASKARLVVQYLDNLRDWNLSRQIPWGIPIPAFQNTTDPSDWRFEPRVELPTITEGAVTYQRDEDTFDTWFSSGQWPFITTEGALERFYPNSVMETGHDLLDRWVARMVMLGLYVTGEVPFRHVYMHGMVLDEKGQKMSKSKGNVINPMDYIDRYGSDALRIGIASNRSAGQNQAFSSAKVVAGRNFCNKLWNIARYIEGRLADTEPEAAVAPETLADHWVIGRLLLARGAIDEHMAAYRFAEAVDTVYHVVWDDVADWYIEASKQQVGQGMLRWVLETCLKLAHPFAPFVTETIWTTLKWEPTLLISAQWPDDITYHEVSAGEFEQIQTLVAEARYVAGELEGKQTLLYQHDSLIADNAGLIARLAGLKAVEASQAPHGLRLAVANREAWLAMDADTLYEHQERLELRLAECRQQIQRLEGRLANEGYIRSAPAAIVEQSRQQLAEQRTIEGKLVAELQVIES